MKLLNSILTVAITLTAFNSLAGVNDNNESRLACSLYSYQANFVRQDLNNAKRFSQMNVGPTVKPYMQDNEKILASMFSRRNELTKSLEKISSLRVELKKQLATLNEVVAKPNSWGWKPSASTLGKIEIEKRYLIAQIEYSEKKQTAMFVELESLNKQIEKQKLLLSSSSVDDVKESRVGIERKAYFSQRAAALEKELSKLHGLLSQLCK